MNIALPTTSQFSCQPRHDVSVTARLGWSSECKPKKGEISGGLEKSCVHRPFLILARINQLI